MPSTADLEFYYFGFYRILKRYRFTSLLGWAIVFLACLSIPLGWNTGRATDLIVITLTLLTVFAGLAVVWQNISALENYLRIPFPHTNDEAFVGEIRELMKDVDSGGWQEAYEAIGRIKELQIKHSLPSLERQ